MTDAALRLDPAPSSRALTDVRGATFAVVVLTAMNLLNYVDRYVPSAVKTLFQADLHLSDKETSFPLTALVIVYMIASPMFGALSTRVPRKWVIALGVGLWSAATAAAAFATNFWTFVVARSAVGVGEAAYATLTPSILSDFFPPARRNRVLTVFYAAIPIGAAVGYTVGSALGARFGWRTAFLACGLPGLVTAGVVLFMREPPRGQFDPPAARTAVPWAQALRAFRARPEYVVAVAGYTAVTFASGGLADWFPKYLIDYRGMTVAEAGRLTGVTAALGGLIGTTMGGLIADRLRGRTRQPYFALSAVSMLGAGVFVSFALVLHDHAAIWACAFLGQTLLWCYNGPINAIIVNAVPAELRAQAVAVSILCIHAFGDALSPFLVGVISDASGSLQEAMILVPVTVVVGTMIWARGWRTLQENPL